MKLSFRPLYQVFSTILLVALYNASLANSDDSHKESEWTALFNGKNLDGWSIQCQAADKGKPYWSVQDGAITCDSIGDKKHEYVWLQYDTEYADFELKLKFKGFRDSPGNTGVQVRSRYDSSENGGWLDGPQVDINPSKPFRNGLIYDETRSENRWISPSLPNWSISEEHGPENYLFRYSDENDGWNDMHIICKGTQITTIVNGIKISDYNGIGTLDNEEHQRLKVGIYGYIALQLHKKDEIKVQFKDIYLKRL